MSCTGSINDISSVDGAPHTSWSGSPSFPLGTQLGSVVLAASKAERCSRRRTMLGQMMERKRLIMISLSPHSKCSSHTCTSFLRSGSHNHRGGVCVHCMLVIIALMIGLVYKSRISMLGNESGTALAREGFLELRCPNEFVRSSLRRSSCHVVRNPGSSSQLKD